MKRHLFQRLFVMLLITTWVFPQCYQYYSGNFYDMSAYYADEASCESVGYLWFSPNSNECADPMGSTINTIGNSITDPVSYTTGDPWSVDWNISDDNPPTGLGSSIHIYLYHKNSYITKLTTGPAQSTGLGTWPLFGGYTIPSDLPTSTCYHFVIAVYYEVAPFDPYYDYYFVGDYFTISNPTNPCGDADCNYGENAGTCPVDCPSITVTSPDGGESWQMGSPQTITWTSANLSSEYVIIQLFENGFYNYDIASPAYNVGWSYWTIPTNFNSNSSYMIRIYEYGNSVVYDGSNSSFYLTDPQSIIITSPSSSVNWQMGSTHAITWTSANLSNDYMNIELYENGTFFDNLVSSTYNNGSYDWTIPTNLSSSNSYMIFIHEVGNTSQAVAYANFYLADPGSINVTSPDGAESWQMGSTQTITWTSANLSNESVKIELYEDGTFYDNIDASTYNDGSYDWTIPTDLSNSKAYMIRIIDYGNVAAYGDGSFNVTDPGSITVTSPNGTEIWESGSTQTITWSSANLSNNSEVTISLYKGGLWYMNLESLAQPNSGSYSWYILSSLSGSADSDYRIRIEDASNSLVYDESDGDFSLIAPASITVTSPNGGENWLNSSTQTITWASSNLSEDTVDISIYKDGILLYTIINTPNDGSFIWQLGYYHALIDLATSNNYKIRINEYNNSELYDESNANFGITNPSTASSITITSPNGGENWEIDSTYTITWSSTNISGNYVDISYKENSNPAHHSIAALAVNNGSYSWIIPDTVMISSDYNIRIMDSGDDTIYDYSDNFSITGPSSAPSITVTSPNGGENWTIDSTYTITWTSENINYVTIKLYNESPAGLDAITTMVSSNNGANSYSWVISDTHSTGSVYKIQILDYNNSTVYDYSDNTFSLSAPAVPASITVTSPNGGENWEIDSTYTITWSSTNISGNYVDISYKENSNPAHHSIAALAVNNGSYSWIIPDTVMISSDYKIRIIDSGDVSVYDYSDATFSIAGPSSAPSITVTSPNGGENWTIDSTYTITWTSENINYVTIKLYNESPAGLDAITTMVSSNNGANSYSWVISDTHSTGSVYKIQILDYNNSTIYDYSDATFSLTDSSIVPSIGCMDPSACNYDVMAGTDDGSCKYIDACGICPGDNNILPTFNISYPSHFMLEGSDAPFLSLYPGTVQIEFSGTLVEGSQTGVSLLSTIGSGFDGNDWESQISAVADSVINVHINTLYASDVIKLNIDWNSISFSDCYNDSTTVDSTTVITLYTQILGDYSHNNDLDGDDIEYFINYWNNTTNHDTIPPQKTNMDLAPATGSPPHFHSLPDGAWNVDDIMVFIRSWKWFQEHSPIIERKKNNYTTDFGQPIELEIINNQLTMEFFGYDKAISRIWFQLSLPSKEINFEVAKFGSQFDINLETNAGENVHIWDLAKIGNGLNIKSLTLGAIDTQNREEFLQLELQFKLKSLDGLLSSGTMMVDYSPIPVDFDLSDAYPNPFNPTTTVSYALPNDGNMTLSVYDLQGRQLTELASGFTSAGYYQAVWDASPYSSGLYFIRMNVYGSGNTLQFNTFKKIILVK